MYNHLSNLNNLNIYPFHMPGHKRNHKFFIPNLQYLDFTELDYTDNLHNPNGIIETAQKDLSQLVNSHKSYFLVNGSSCGIIASIMSLCKAGDKILIARNCHISVYNALIITGAIPIYIYPDITDKGLAGGISLKHITEVICENPNIKCCIITSPTYEGFVSDIQSISNYLHSNNIPLIVDEAHGATFGLHKFLPKSALSCGADIVIQSFHKTLPVLTQCSTLHINNSKFIDINRLEKFISIMQTTSPSYLLMTSIDYCVKIIQNEGHELFDYLINSVEELRKNQEKNNIIQLVSKDIVGKYSIFDLDITRLTFLCNCNNSGSEIEKILLKDYKLQVEYSSVNHFIAICTIADKYYGFALLNDAITTLNNSLTLNKSKIFNNKIIVNNKIILSPKESFEKDKIAVDLHKSTYEISADFVTPYPPGIPILCPGEEITKEIIETLKLYLNNKINVIGIINGQINVIKNKENLYEL